MRVRDLLNNNVPENTVLVIGAALSGAFSALEAARRGWRVFLIDKEDKIIPDSSSSNNECYKLHTGLHYAGNLKTALACLEDSIAYARQIPAECLAGTNDPNDPCRRGRHFVMSNSLFPPEEIKKVALILQKRYSELVAKDPKNKVFGEPEDFIKFLSESDYPYVAKEIPFTDTSTLRKEQIKVVLGIETGESQIDINKVRGYLTREINSHPNISFVPNVQVLNLSPLSDQLGYAVTVATPTGKQIWHVPAIVNCAWQNIESLSKQLGFYTPDENRVIRVKVCAQVELPPSLRSVNTCIFSIGPFASFTNLGNGQAVLASELTTNVGFYRVESGNRSFELAELMKTPLNPQTGRGAQLSDKIRRECANYLPDLAEAKISKVMLGYVKMTHVPTSYNGSSSLCQKHSPIHQRLERGVEVESGALGYIANSGNKMTYTLRNAEAACHILQHHFQLRESLKQTLSVIKPVVVEKLKKINKKYVNHLTDTLLLNVFKRAILSNSSDSSPEAVLHDVLSVIEKKERMLALIRSRCYGKKLVSLAAPDPIPAPPQTTARL